MRHLSEKARYDEASVHAILDAGLVAQVAFIQGEAGCCATIYGRDGNRLHRMGLVKPVYPYARKGPSVCLNVTLLDGIVYARSLFNSSMNYRSVTVHGTATLIEGDERVHALSVISEHVMQGAARKSALHEKEILMTGNPGRDESASAKISMGPPDDEDEDMDAPVWAGVMPLG